MEKTTPTATRSVVVTGTFDVDAATELAHRLILQRSPQISLDLSKVTEWCIFAMVALAERLRGAGQSLSVTSWPAAGCRARRHH